MTANPIDTHRERQLGRLIVQIAALYTSANIPILIIALPARRTPRPPLTFAMYMTRVGRVNNAIQRALGNTNAFVWLPYGVRAGEPHFFQEDGIHLNSQGYQLVC